VEWILAIITFAAAVAIVVFVPETQYTGGIPETKAERTWKDDLRFWPVSGGGKPKDHRCG
jgi:hypothetical protein